jgi:2-polyprenyl-3-methyl-5-hydroxy-6-metoxy-1,4-benzoquinol methylase
MKNINIEERAKVLDNEEPWITFNKLGASYFAKKKINSREKTSLAAKQALLFHVLESFMGSLSGKRILDIGSNQGYTTLEALMRGALVDSIEPYSPNRRKTEFVIEVNGFIERAKVHDDLMENICKERYGIFDAILFLGTIYHAEHPYDILKKISQMTDIVLIES